MQNRPITEAQPMSHRCDDGALVEIRKAGGPEGLFTLTDGGERIITLADEAQIRAIARARCVAHNARYAAGLAATATT